MTFFTGTNSSESFLGLAEDDIALALGGDDTLDGGAGADQLYGGVGNDTFFDRLTGGAGDRMFGGLGDDEFVCNNQDADFLDGGFGADFYVVSSDIGTTIDLVDQKRNSGIAAGDVLTSIEAFRGGGGADRFLGSSGTEFFDYSEGAGDFFDGRGGFDIYESEDADATEVDLRLTFGAEAAQLASAEGITLSSAKSGVAAYTIWNDADGDSVRDAGEIRTQIDELLNIEHFVIDTNLGTASIKGSGKNEVFYSEGAATSIDGGDGFDFVSFSDLGSGGAVILDLASGTVRQGNDTGALLNIEHVVGSTSGDQIFGNQFGNRLLGASGGDVIDGRGGIDRIDGGDGIDFLSGGAGDDLLIGGDGGDVIDGGAGLDTVCYATSSTGVSIQLDVGATSSADGDGDDFISVERLIGSRFGDQIRGNDAANVIEGFGGSDRIFGGGGNDLLYAGSRPGSLAAADFAGLNPTVEIGDGPDEVVEDDPFFIPDLFGGAGNDRLFGGDAGDDLFGGVGDDFLSGGGGDDELTGGAGNDTYLINSLSDDVNEEEGEGIDTVRTFVDYSLDANVENARAFGGLKVRIGGNRLDNFIEGNAAANALDGNGGNDSLKGGAGDDDLLGGEGRDRLTGGAGDDIFRLTGQLEQTNVDIIEDFAVADDRIFLDRQMFDTLAGNGRLGAGAFRLGTAALDAGDRILYDQATGRIFYDADGNGSGAASVLVAQVDAGVALNASHFVAFDSITGF